MKIKNKFLLFMGLAFLIIGLLAYLSEKVATFNLKVYGTIVFIIGIIILIESLIGNSRIYPLKLDEKALRSKNRKPKT